MDTKTQLKKIVQQLTENGKVSRNWALKNYITRLSARILDLRNAGWEIEARNERTMNGYGRGLDRVYKLIKRP